MSDIVVLYIDKLIINFNFIENSRNLSKSHFLRSNLSNRWRYIGDSYALSCTSFQLRNDFFVCQSQIQVQRTC